MWYKKPLKVFCEEVAEHTTIAGKATDYHGKILRRGRKYDLHSMNMLEALSTIIDLFVGSVKS
ncbi:hypothetical protein C9J01_10870 [Photobacterium rosenbergii]|uniref:Uncharacterized protein n=1 Tax=Photobacterium rosenbergii TaxID=294936 RepID=A0A2T3NFP8_9GAMM|nr:hypothetical protein C9J01_10870 [Photobacterium rosenbergii]